MRNKKIKIKKKNRENTRQRKTITHIRQYLCGSAICLRPWSCRDFTIIRKKLQVAATIFFFFFFLSIKHSNNTTLKKKTNYKRRFHNRINGPKKFPLGQRLGPISPSLRSMDYASVYLPLKTTQHYSGWVVKPDQAN